MKLTAIYFYNEIKDFMSFYIFKTLEKLKQNVAILELSFSSVESAVINRRKLSIPVDFISNL